MRKKKLSMQRIFIWKLSETEGLGCKSQPILDFRDLKTKSIKALYPNWIDMMFSMISVRYTPSWTNLYNMYTKKVHHYCRGHSWSCKALTLPDDYPYIMVGSLILRSTPSSVMKRQVQFQIVKQSNSFKAISQICLCRAGIHYSGFIWAVKYYLDWTCYSL